MTLNYSNLKLKDELEYVTESPQYKLLYFRDRKRFYLQKNQPRNASLIPSSLKRACKIMNIKEEQVRAVI